MHLETMSRNRVYGHRDLRDLKIEIEKIDKECFVTLL